MKCRKNGSLQGHQMLKRAKRRLFVVRAKRRLFVVFSGLKSSLMSFFVVYSLLYWQIHNKNVLANLASM